MLPVELFRTTDRNSPFAKALLRAEKAKPDVYFMFSDASTRKIYYLVKRTDKISEYVVRIWIDPDGAQFVECECHNGKPPLDAKTKLPAFDPAPCTHAGAVLLFIGEREGA